MKLKVIVPPLAAMILAGALLTFQSRTLSSVRSRTETLTREIAGEANPSSHGLNRPSGKTSVSWRRLGDLIGDQRTPGIFARQELLRADAEIRSMTRPELLAALAEVATLDLDIFPRGQLEAKLIVALGEVDPAAALAYLADNDDHEGLPYSLQTGILAGWAKKDLSTATRWLDAEIAAGALDDKSLDGRNFPRFRMEAGLLSSLVESDPAAAAVRLAAFDEKHRADVLSELVHYLGRESKPPGDRTLYGYASLVREMLPPSAQPRAIAAPVSTLAMQDGYQQIDRYFENITATPAERALGVADAMASKFDGLVWQNQISPSEIDSVRQWALIQSPDTVDEATAEALRSISSHGSNAFNRAADLALHYHEVTGNDEILTGFLDYGISPQNKPRARLLAERISDPAKRAEAQGRIK